MKLYYSPGACSLASHIALVESGRDFDAVKVDLSRHETENGQDFYGISKRGYVPVIETDEGVLTENPAVLAYLARYTDAAPEGRAWYKMLEWIGYVGSEIHGAYGPLFGNGGEAEKVNAKDEVARKFRVAVDILDRDDWLVADRPTVADNYLFVTTLWARKMGIDTPDWIADFRDRNLARDSVKKAMAAEGLG
ncbi:glutathione S-transferase [Parasphingopyxis algicola]|uniref:glutathione binding-like protein n=1 Tax=Parasphingopyxis algicola TaxID=2026624 RepID=UPI0015A2F370|nr:glutathione binding-like protein [Parasphingopyxis algicola]QLC25887.1 glutathione S-transferase [Parasphingopyxis algicola]